MRSDTNKNYGEARFATFSEAEYKLGKSFDHTEDLPITN